MSNQKLRASLEASQNHTLAVFSVKYIVKVRLEVLRRKLFGYFSFGYGSQKTQWERSGSIYLLLVVFFSYVGTFTWSIATYNFRLVDSGDALILWIECVPDFLLHW